MCDEFLFLIAQKNSVLGIYGLRIETETGFDKTESPRRHIQNAGSFIHTDDVPKLHTRYAQKFTELKQTFRNCHEKHRMVKALQYIVAPTAWSSAA